MMTNRWAYSNPPETVEDYQAAINEAYGQAESLYEHSERLAAEAERWVDRGRTLEMEMMNL
jgi:hypothetical protein